MIPDPSIVSVSEAFLGVVQSDKAAMLPAPEEESKSVQSAEEEIIQTISEKDMIQPGLYSDVKDKLKSVHQII